MAEPAGGVKRWLPVFLLVAGCAPAPGPTVRVAAAASLRPALEPLAERYRRDHPGESVELTFGASGTLYAQAAQGGPIDLFLSADEEYPRRLAAEGHANPAAVFRFAHGRLALWVRTGVPGDGLEALTRPEVGRVALANPRLAPYGRAAQSALENAGMWDAVRPKAAFPGNVEEVAAALHAGVADAGFVPLSLARKLPPGRITPLAAELPHGGVLLKPAAGLFRDTLLGPAGRECLEAAGFAAP